MTLLYVIASVGSFLAGIGAIISLFMFRKQGQIEVHMNGRIDELIDTHRKLGKAEGKAEAIASVVPLPSEVANTLDPKRDNDI